MKAILTCFIATILSLLSCASVVAADSAPPGLHGPTVGIEDAIRIARELLQKQRISVTDSYIDSTRLEQNQSGDRRKFWIVTWLRNEYFNETAMKGGQIYVHIYMDGTGEIFRGE
jgi:hypothetical protein